METKTCRRCGESKPVSEFYIHQGTADGVGSVCKTCQKTYKKQYYLDRRELLILRNRRREARKAGALGSFALEQWQALKFQYPYCPGGCGRLFTDDLRPTIDHIVPVSKGGSDCISNIQPLCKSCNCRKGKKVQDFRRQQKLMPKQIAEAQLRLWPIGEG